MFVPIFNNGNGLLPKKLSKKQFIVTCLYIIISAILIGITEINFEKILGINVADYPNLFSFGEMLIRFIAFGLFVINLLSLYKHWKSE